METKTSRDLDAQVARVLGCKVIPHSGSPDNYDACGCPHRQHANHEPNDDTLASYSTNPCFLTDMLLWAAEHHEGDINLEWDANAKRWGAWIWTASHSARIATGDASTPSLALALALCALQETGEETT